MEKSEVIAEAIEAINSEAISSSEDDRAQEATNELEAGRITGETIASMDECVDHWWKVFGSSLGGDGEESLGELLIKQLETASDKLKSFL